MVFEKLRDTLAQQLDIDPEKITMDTNIIDDLGADSLDVVELIMSLEDEYGVVITDDAIREMYTVREVVEFIEKLI